MKLIPNYLSAGSIIVISMLFFSFTFPPKKVNIENFIKFYQNNLSSFEKNETAGILNTKIQFIPADFTTIKLLNEDIELAKEFQRETNNPLTFRVQLSVPSIGLKEFLQLESDTLSFEDRVVYYSFNFKNDILYQWDNEVMKSVNDFHFERLFNMSPFGNFDITIPKPSKKVKRLKIIVRDRIYDNTINSFEFEMKKINDIPVLESISKLNLKSSK